VKLIQFARDAVLTLMTRLKGISAFTNSDITFLKEYEEVMKFLAMALDRIQGKPLPFWTPPANCFTHHHEVEAARVVTREQMTSWRPMIMRCPQMTKKRPEMRVHHTLSSSMANCCTANL